MTRTSFFSLPNLLTFANAGVGLVAVLLLLGEAIPAIGRSLPLVAAAIVFVAFVLDLADGIVARRYGRPTGHLGAILDSLADMLSFGIAPALMLATVATGPKPVGLAWLGLVAAFFYAGAVLARLARFTERTVSGTHASSTPLRVFEGLPAPAAAMMIATTVLLRGAPLGLLPLPVEHVAPWALMALGLTTPVLMVSSLPFPDLPKFYIYGILPRWHLGLLGAAAFVAGPATALLLLALVYLTLGTGLAARVESGMIAGPGDRDLSRSRNPQVHR